MPDKLYAPNIPKLGLPLDLLLVRQDWSLLSAAMIPSQQLALYYLVVRKDHQGELGDAVVDLLNLIFDPLSFGEVQEVHPPLYFVDVIELGLY